MNRTQWVVLLAVVVLMFAAIGACLAGRCTGNKPPAELSDLTVGRIGIPEVPKLPELTRPETDTAAPAGLDVSLATRPRAPQVLEVLTETGERGKEE
mgnify:FL=1